MWVKHHLLRWRPRNSGWKLDTAAEKPSCVRPGALGAWQRDKLQTSESRRHVAALIPLRCAFWVCFVSSEPPGVRLQRSRGGKRYLESTPACPQLPLLFAVTLLRVFTFGNIWFGFSKKRKRGGGGGGTTISATTSSKPGAAIRLCLSFRPSSPLTMCSHW